VTVVLDYTVVPDLVQNCSYEIDVQDDDIENFDYVFIHITTSTKTWENGYYIWHPNSGGVYGASSFTAWNDLTNNQSSGTIEIDYTNSHKINTQNCPTGSGWYFGTNATEVFNRFKGCEVNEQLAGSDDRYAVTTAANYDFTIV
jgi:uncharacterized protein YjhX (UPF0386 family)